MEQYISKNELVREIEKRIEETKGMQPQFDQFWAGQISAFKGVLKIIDTLEVKEVTNEKTDWSPSKKQMESLKDMLKWNIGDFNYQKWMEVNSLYDDLTKMLGYETDR